MSDPTPRDMIEGRTADMMDGELGRAILRPAVSAEHAAELAEGSPPRCRVCSALLIHAGGRWQHVEDVRSSREPTPRETANAANRALRALDRTWQDYRNPFIATSIQDVQARLSELVEAFEAHVQSKG